MPSCINHAMLYICNMANQGRPQKVRPGMTFGKLTAINRIDKHPSRHPKWECSCSCGGSKTVLSSNLLNGSTSSCGCARLGVGTTHGMSGTRIYSIWLGMHYRCNNGDPVYGGRGISVYKRWGSFENFYADMQEGYSETMTIERIDVNKGYSKSNCKWIPKSEQSKNKRDTILVIDKCLRDACKAVGMPYNTVWQRVKHLGWSVEDALSKPVRGQKHGKAY